MDHRKNFACWKFFCILAVGFLAGAQSMQAFGEIFSCGGGLSGEKCECRRSAESIGGYCGYCGYGGYKSACTCAFKTSYEKKSAECETCSAVRTADYVVGSENPGNARQIRLCRTPDGRVNGCEIFQNRARENADRKTSKDYEIYTSDEDDEEYEASDKRGTSRDADVPVMRNIPEKFSRDVLPVDPKSAEPTPAAPKKNAAQPAPAERRNLTIIEREIPDGLPEKTSRASESAGGFSYPEEESLIVPSRRNTESRSLQKEDMYPEVREPEEIPEDFELGDRMELPPILRLQELSAQARTVPAMKVVELKMGSPQRIDHALTAAQVHVPRESEAENRPSESGMKILMNENLVSPRPLKELENFYWDDQVRQTQLEKLMIPAPGNFAADADDLAKLAEEGEKTATETRLREFSNVPPPRPRNNAFPEDEYIIDTSQPGYIQQRKPGRRSDLEMTDADWRLSAEDREGTVIHYSTPGGYTTLQTTDPVYIYSPRFRAVRQVVDPTTNEQMVKLGNVDSQMQLGTQARTVGPQRNTKNQQAIQNTGRNQMVQLDGKQFGSEMSRGQVVKGFLQDQQAAQEGNHTLSPWQYDGTISPWNADKIQNAVTWSGTEQLIVFVDHQRAAAAIGVQSAPSFFVVTEEGEKPQIQIYKVASTDSAKSGEIVTFMIRFENTGNTPISNILIIDNLTARLELDASSSESSMGVSFSYQPNANGSSLLRWEVVEPLYPKEWGVVRFNCVVR